MLRAKLLLFILLLVGQLQAQIGGESSYEFLNIPHTALVSGLGGMNVSLADKDVNLLFNNPALVGEQLHGNIGFNYLAYLGGINLSSVTYAHYLNDVGTIGGGVQYLNLGSVDTYDASGNLTGTAQSGEINTNFTFSHQVNSFRLGGGVKWVSSTIANYQSNALLFDLGGVFVHPEKDLRIGLVVKNMGVVLTEYSSTSKSTLPFDVQVGVSYKPEHMPFRLSLTGYNLTTADVSYFDEDATFAIDKPTGFDKVLSHFVIATEVVLGKNVNLRVGYNHLIRESLRLEDYRGLNGISLGLEVKVKKIAFAYAHGGYHAAGGINNFTISTNMYQFVGGAKQKNNDGE